MHKLKSLVIDDERLARRELTELLKEFKNIEVVGEADNVDSAIEKINQLNPDVLFLDIQMHKKTGFDLINSVNTNAKVIFITAYDKYAIRAFEINALDYLLKPLSHDRLKQAIDRLEKEDSQSEMSSNILEYNDFLLLSLNNQLKFINIESITLISSASNYTELICDDGTKGLTLKSMKEWEQRLPKKHFCRIHRSIIINLERVIKIEPWTNNSYHIWLKGIEKQVTLSRRYLPIVKKILS